MEISEKREEINKYELDPNGNQDEEDPPSYDETGEAIDRLRNNRAPSSDNISSELLKIRKPVLMEQTHRIINKVWKTEVIPREWEEG